MPNALSLLDRLRVERVVWALDQQLYDLPRRSRIGTRREMRVNLLAAAGDVGVTEALLRVGSSRRLAEGYLEAELGEGPRHSWIAAAYFCAGVPLLLAYLLGEADAAYQRGVIAADPHVTGTFSSHGVSYLQSQGTVSFVQGHLVASSGGAWTPLVYLLWLAGTIACGRLWRLVPPLRQRHRQPVTAA